MNQRTGAQMGAYASSARRSQMQPEIVQDWREGVPVVAVSGDHDVTTAAKVRATIREANGGRKNVVLSLEKLAFMDSSIMGVLFISHRALVERGARLIVHCPDTTPVCQLLRVARLDDVVDVVQTLEEAIDLARRPLNVPASDQAVAERVDLQPDVE